MLNKTYIKSPLENTIITLNYSLWDVENKLVTANICLKLQEVGEFAINYIINKYKKFNYLFGKQLELSLVITNDNNIKEINHEWRQILAPTNVLSMGLFSKIDAKLSDLVLLGDVIISIETANKEAQVYNISEEDHLIRLLVHGILHIFGFNHTKNKEAELMHSLESAILENFTKHLPGLTANYWN